MHISAATATELFVGAEDQPLQIVRVSYTQAAAATEVRIEGDGLSTPDPAIAPAGEGTVEVAGARSPTRCPARPALRAC